MSNIRSAGMTHDEYESDDDFFCLPSASSRKKEKYGYIPTSSQNITHPTATTGAGEDGMNWDSSAAISAVS